MLPRTPKHEMHVLTKCGLDGHEGRLRGETPKGTHNRKRPRMSRTGGPSKHTQIHMYSATVCAHPPLALGVEYTSKKTKSDH